MPISPGTFGPCQSHSCFSPIKTRSPGILTPIRNRSPGAKTDDPGVLLSPTATDDVLLNAFLVRLLVESAYSAYPAPTLTDGADGLAAHLRSRQPAVFDAVGDRLSGVGEYVVALLPQINGAQVQSAAVLEVWTRENADRPTAAWKKIKSLVTDHARRSESVP